jgi:hypothetical protein
MEVNILELLKLKHYTSGTVLQYCFLFDCSKSMLRQPQDDAVPEVHSRAAIRFYKIHTPLTEAVLPGSGNYKTIVSFCYQLLRRKTTQAAEK